MTETRSSSICLSYEEIIFLLRAMGEPNLPGLEQSPWPEITDAMAEVMIQVTSRALFSRGLARPGEGNQLLIDPALQSTLMACVHPEQMLRLAYQNGQEAGQHWYYRVAEFAVRQTPIAPYIFEFELSEKTDWGWPQVEELLLACPEEGSENIFNIDADVFEKARLAVSDCSSGLESAAGILMEGGVSQPWAGNLARAIQSARVRLLLQYSYQLSPSLVVDSITLLASSSDCWLISVSPEANQVVVASMPRSQLKKVLQSAHRKFG